MFALGLVCLLLGFASPVRADQNVVQVPTGSPLSGLGLVNDVNGALDSLATIFSGPSEPTTALCGPIGCSTAGYLWHDTGTNTIKIRDQIDANWITLFGIDENSKVGSAAAPVLSTSSPLSISGADHYPNVVLTASTSLSLSRANTLWNGFSFSVFAQGGNVTLLPNAADKINGGTLGASVIVPQGYAASLVTDAAGTGTWSVAMERMALGNCSVASATTVDLAAQGCPALNITGSTGPISGFGSTAQAGQVFFVTFASTPQLTYNATSMILNTGGANYTASAGDRLIAKALGSGNFEVTIAPASGAPPIGLSTPPLALVSGLTGESSLAWVSGSQHLHIDYNIGEITAKPALGGVAVLGSNLALGFDCDSSTGAGHIDTGTCATATGQLNLYLINNGSTFSTLGWMGASTATVTATVSSGVVTGTSGLSGGLGYSRPPRVYASAETGCSSAPSFHATVSGGSVTSVVVDGTGGSGCSAVTIAIAPPDCEVYGGTHMPSGYSAMALLGSYMLSAGVTPFPAGGPPPSTQSGYFWQIGRTVNFGLTNVLSISSSVPTSYSTAPVSIAADVPGNARSVGGNLGAPNSSGVIAAIASDPNGLEAQHCGIGTESTILDSMDAGCPFSYLPILSFPSGNPTFYYKSGSSAFGVRVDLTSYSLGEQEP